MTYKSLVAVASGGADDGVLLHAAAGLAAKAAAHLTIVPAFPDPAADYVYYGAVLSRGLAARAMAAIEESEREQMERLGALARTAASRAGLALSDTVETGPSLFLDKRALNPIVAVSDASLFSDLMMFSAVAAGARLSLSEVFAATLLFDRAPILVVRDERPVLEARVAIAWDASAQAARAVRAALPLLIAAPAITLIQHAKGLTEEQAEAADPARISRYLARHGAPAPSVRATDGAREGEAILEAAKDAHCGVLVAGAYGRSRLHEMVLGGASRAFVQAADGPHLLLAH